MKWSLKCSACKSDVVECGMKCDQGIGATEGSERGNAKADFAAEAAFGIMY